VEGACGRRKEEKDKGITQEEEGGAREKHVVSSGTERLTKERHQRAREGWDGLSGGRKSEKKDRARPRAEEAVQNCWKNVERKSREQRERERETAREREREREMDRITKRGR